MAEHRQDPQDEQLGAPAARDAKIADDLALRGRQMPDERGVRPRAGDKAESSCTVHEDHDHVHGEGCGHETVEHDGHLDFLHGGHRHAAHGGHWDEHRDES